MMDKWMKRGFYLGVGAAISGKERFEKMVQDMVDKGEMTPKEAKAMMNEWVEKGQNADTDFTNQTRTMMKDRLKEIGFVTEEDYYKLEARVERLEKLHRENEND
ncbi:hypothetical protein AAV35_002065 [Salimicrobium jeotgali]|uniref:Polyhydroxyalkanoate synthesis regulator phasin n=2 Tax=Salimicrobium TaxID=351195 RepID=K2GKH7_9BACI|nr:MULTISPECIES: hypothetical protein [Salimicrobium]AKG03690.1 hypothetical protein AAV35_002065 [Salimicrobium jeotgali]EKE30924.1 hypothetical protein MJ3_11065 [Salimicrobium jeotgali]MBM7697563.1 polyhydroxyalkanoate synthesis regulator phasin [Salimicrobium jeotgali]PBB06372.1 hypothetical protein CKW00_03310 [Salimicrobium humidisoli]